MRIVPLVENTTKSELKAKHGLSLYIETKLHKILFDLGSDNTLFDGGAMKKFLDVNSSANILYKKKRLNRIIAKHCF